MDMQMGILGNYLDADELLDRVSVAIEKARTKGIPVMYVHLGFRPGGPELNPENRFFQRFKREEFTPAFMERFMQIHPKIAPKDGDIIIEKRRVSAFSGSDLEVILRAQGIKHLILSGISTSGVVLSTTREAADKDYKITILSDCCADSDKEVHEVLLEKVLNRQAEVVRVEDWK
ncbi:MAG: cysteine hydrolase [Patescibacteria group bacterium]|nr:cysteine hydrolase [Patescibacteria group bacterium]